MCVSGGVRIRIIGRDDSLLLAGLTFALLIVFQSSLQYGLNIAREIEHTYGVALTPALLMLSVMFVFHQSGKRREMKAEAAAASAEAALARARATEMEQLVEFGQDLAGSLSIDALREAVWRHLPRLSGNAEAWLVLRTDSGWERLTDRASTRWPAGQIEGIAERVSNAVAAAERSTSIECEGHVCFPLVADTRLIGVLALASHPAGPAMTQTIGAAAALLSIAIRNAQLFADVRDSSIKDGLTGCFNRAHTFDVLENEIARSGRGGTPLSVVLFDVDHFKAINDRYGHLCGDRVLAAVGQRLGKMLRRSDVQCRYGGDEFLVVLPETDEKGARRVAEWLRSELGHLEVDSTGGCARITISAGTATSIGGDTTAAALVERADEALYDAKQAGRNCVGMPAFSTGAAGGLVRRMALPAN